MKVRMRAAILWRPANNMAAPTRCKYWAYNGVNVYFFGTKCCFLFLIIFASHLQCDHAYVTVLCMYIGVCEYCTIVFFFFCYYVSRCLYGVSDNIHLLCLNCFFNILSDSQKRFYIRIFLFITVTVRRKTKRLLYLTTITLLTNLLTL